MKKIIGIDLGTTYSLCAHFENSRPGLIPNSFGEYLTPSVVGFLKSGEIVVGSPARELQVTRPENCAWCFKRLMGTDQKIKIGSHSLSAPELSSFVLRQLKEDAQVHLNEPIDEAVITVPAYFNEHQRRATALAGELAGLKVRRIINEPTVAALTYGFQDRQEQKTLLVFDLGGGTFDVTLMEIFEGTLEIIATAGENFLGGENFTDLILAWALRHQGLELEIAEFKEPLRVARMREICEKAKRDLTSQKEVPLLFANKEGEIERDGPPLKLTREEFLNLSRDLLNRLSRPLGRVLRDGETEAPDVEEVLLVGGATRMPLVQNFVEDYFSKAPLCKFNPDEVVALGAAVQSALMEDHRDTEDLVMTDVCPHTLGISIVKIFGNQIRDGYFLPIIHRNTTIPVSREESVATIYPDQQELNIRIYQGESRRAEENLYLGELKVKGLPPGPAGTEVFVRFTYDLNGILEVEAYIPSNGKKYQALLTHNVKGLSEKEIQKALEKMSHLKFYPREDLQNRRLILFCERIIGEINPYERQELEEALDSFEGAMELRDPEIFEMMKNNLLVLLSRLGYDFGESPE